MFNFILILFNCFNCAIYLSKLTLIWGIIKRYRKILSTNSLYGRATNVTDFLDGEKKGPLVIVHKIHDKKGQASNVYLRFFSISWSRSLPCEIVCVTHDKVPVLL